MVLHQSPCMVFPKWNQIVEQIIPSLVEKTMEKHVFLTLGCHAIVLHHFICGCLDFNMTHLHW
jgi:hypothetical protein